VTLPGKTQKGLEWLPSMGGKVAKKVIKKNKKKERKHHPLSTAQGTSQP